MTQKYKYATPEVALSFVKILIENPETKAALETGSASDGMTTESKVLISRTLEEFQSRAPKGREKEYQFLDAAIVAGRLLVEGKFSGTNDPELYEYFVKTLIKDL